MRKSTNCYPSLNVDTTAKRVVSHAGAVVVAATAVKVGLDRELSSALRPWRRPLAVHDPGKVLLDLAMSVAVGGDSLADIAQVRAEPAVFGLVASDPTVSRLIDTLAADAPAVLTAINTARAKARARVWHLAGTDSPDHQVSVKAPLIVILDAYRKSPDQAKHPTPAPKPCIREVEPGAHPGDTRAQDLPCNRKEAQR